jgi:hypothetical protein
MALSSGLSTPKGSRFSYLSAVKNAFGNDIDYAMLIKVYCNTEEALQSGCLLSVRTQAINGSPDPDHISMSYVERSNLTMRMNMRRFTRFTNGFREKIENHAAQIAIFMMMYNFGRKHMTLGTTPAVKAGIADHIWTWRKSLAFLKTAKGSQRESNCTTTKFREQGENRDGVDKVLVFLCRGAAVGGQAGAAGRGGWLAGSGAGHRFSL